MENEQTKETIEDRVAAAASAGAAVRKKLGLPPLTPVAEWPTAGLQLGVNDKGEICVDSCGRVLLDQIASTVAGFEKDYGHLARLVAQRYEVVQLTVTQVLADAVRLAWEHKLITSVEQGRPFVEQLTQEAMAIAEVETRRECNRMLSAVGLLRGKPEPDAMDKIVAAADEVAAEREKAAQPPEPPVN